LRIVEAFVVRIWQSEDGAEASGPHLRGVVERVRTGERTPFVDEEELLTLLRRAKTAREREP
jgi:hypothetical protein